MNEDKIIEIQAKKSQKRLDSSYPSFSIIIECENVRFSELRRAEKMLQQVAKQISEISEILSTHPEIIVLYDKEVTKDNNIEQFVRDALQPLISLIDLKLIPTSNLNYFEQKNLGAKNSSNEILIFLDSDVIPNDGWLTSLLSPFTDKEISVVAGRNYISPISMWDKTFALFWIFPPENDKNFKTSQHAEILPNNAAVRRKVFHSIEFPVTSSFRGASTDFSNLVKKHDYNIFIQPNARTAHPSVNGLHHAISKSLAEGHDFVFAWRGSHDKYLKNSSKQKHSIIKFIREKISLYNKRRKYITLSTKEKIQVFCCSSLYSGFLIIGFFLTLINPRIIEGSLKI